MKPFRVRIGRFARAFAIPCTVRQAFALWLRGWRKHESFFYWTKPSPNQRRLESRLAGREGM